MTLARCTGRSAASEALHDRSAITSCCCAPAIAKFGILGRETVMHPSAGIATIKVPTLIVVGGAVCPGSSPERFHGDIHGLEADRSFFTWASASAMEELSGTKAVRDGSAFLAAL